MEVDCSEGSVLGRVVYTEGPVLRRRFVYWGGCSLLRGPVYTGEGVLYWGEVCPEASVLGECLY